LQVRKIDVVVVEVRGRGRSKGSRSGDKNGDSNGSTSQDHFYGESYNVQRENSNSRRGNLYRGRGGRKNLDKTWVQR